MLATCCSRYRFVVPVPCSRIFTSMPPRRRKSSSVPAASPTSKKARKSSPKEVESSKPVTSTGEQQHFLIKSEPDPRFENGVDVSFSWDKFVEEGRAHWDGVRNYQARNIMRDDMKVGDLCFFYHSNCKVPGIIGIAEVCRESYPDHTAEDPKDPHYDPKHSADNPRWFMVDVKPIRKLKNYVSLEQIKSCAELENMALRKRSRLSVQPVLKSEWDIVLRLAGE